MTLSLPHSNRKHSKFSASGAHRWINCPASVKLSETAPKQKPSKYADEGTAAHERAEKALRGQKIVLQEEAVYVDYVNAEVALGKELLLEHKFNLHFIHPEMFGTCDAVIKETFGTLEVIDYKHGAGVAVDVIENEQLLIYALAALWDGEKLDESYEEVKLTIIQPRAFHNDGPIRSWSCGIDYMKKYALDLGEAIRKAEATDAPAIQGEHCKWCPAAMSCPALLKDFLVVETFAEKPIEIPKVNVTRILNARDTIKALIDACEEFVYQQLCEGKPVEGFKLVRGRGSRVWSLKEEELEQKLLADFSPDQIYESGLKSVAQMEKALGKDAIKDFILTKEGALQIAPLTDKRKAVSTAAITDFTVIKE